MKSVIAIGCAAFTAFAAFNLLLMAATYYILLAVLTAVGVEGEWVPVALAILVFSELIAGVLGFFFVALPAVFAFTKAWS